MWRMPPATFARLLGLFAETQSLAGLVALVEYILAEYDDSPERTALLRRLRHKLREA